MKKTIITLAFIAMSAMASFAQSDIPQGKAKVYIIREKGAAIMNELPLFIDNNPICGIRNKRFITINVDTGSHVFSVMTKTRPKHVDSKWDYFTQLRLEAGKSYYLNIEYNYFAMQNFRIDEVPYNTAQKIISELREDICK